MTSYMFENGCSLLVDNCSRFMSTKTVHTRIREIEEDFESQNRDGWMEAARAYCKDEIINQSVIAVYGSRRTMIVKDILFDEGPCSKFFKLKDGEKISVAKYFYKQYKLKISDKKQALLVIR